MLVTPGKTRSHWRGGAVESVAGCLASYFTGNRRDRGKDPVKKTILSREEEVMKKKLGLLSVQ